MEQYEDRMEMIYVRSDFLDTLARFGIISWKSLITYPLSGVYRNRRKWQVIHKNFKNDAQPF